MKCEMESNRTFGIRGGWYDITETHTNNIDHQHANRHHQYCSCISFGVCAHFPLILGYPFTSQYTLLCCVLQTDCRQVSMISQHGPNVTRKFIKQFVFSFLGLHFQQRTRSLMARHDLLFERFTLSNEHINFFAKLLSPFAYVTVFRLKTLLENPTLHLIETSYGIYFRTIKTPRNILDMRYGFPVHFENNLSN